MKWAFGGSATHFWYFVSVDTPASFSDFSDQVCRHTGRRQTRSAPTLSNVIYSHKPFRKWIDRSTSSFPWVLCYFDFFHTLSLQPPGFDRHARFHPQPPGCHRYTRFHPTVMGITTLSTETHGSPRMGPASCSSTRALEQPQCPHVHALVPTRFPPAHVHTATRRCCTPSSVTDAAPHPRRVNPYY